MRGTLKEHSWTISLRSVPWLSSSLCVTRVTWRKQAVSFFNENFEIQRDSNLWCYTNSPEATEKTPRLYDLMPRYYKLGHCVWRVCIVHMHYLLSAQNVRNHSE